MSAGKTAPTIAIASRQVSGVTGTTTTIIEHTRRLARLGWKVHVYGERLDRERISKAGGFPHRLPGLPIGGGLKRKLFVWLFRRAVEKGGFDLVSGHGDTLDQDVLSLHNCVHAAHEAVHGTELPKSSSLGRLHGRILRERRFRLLIANSELMKREVVSRFRVPEQQVKVIHPGYDPGRFNAEGRRLGVEMRRELKIPEGEFLAGLITSGDFTKRGVGILLDALGRLPLALKDRLHVLVIGRETRLASFRIKAREAGLGARTIFLQPQPRVERFLHALDVYVHPALYEEFGQSVQEALACGVPVLTSRRVGASELLGPEGRGLLMDFPEAGALAEKLQELLGDAGLRGRLAEEGARVCRGNTWEKNFEDTLECYLGLLRERGRGA